MIRTFVKKLGLGVALFAGAAFMEPALANAQDIHGRIQAVDHHSHDRGWDGGRWQGRDEGRWGDRDDRRWRDRDDRRWHDRDDRRWHDRDDRRWRDRDDRRWRDRDRWYPAYGGSYYLYVNPYVNAAPNYYGSPSVAPPAYNQNPYLYGGYPY